MAPIQTLTSQITQPGSFIIERLSEIPDKIFSIDEAAIDFLRSSHAWISAITVGETDNQAVKELKLRAAAFKRISAKISELSLTYQNGEWFVQELDKQSKFSESLASKLDNADAQYLKEFENMLAKTIEANGIQVRCAEAIVKCFKELLSSQSITEAEQQFILKLFPQSTFFIDGALNGIACSYICAPDQIHFQPQNDTISLLKITRGRDGNLHFEVQQPVTIQLSSIKLPELGGGIYYSGSKVKCSFSLNAQLKVENFKAEFSICQNPVAEKMRYIPETERKSKDDADTKELVKIDNKELTTLANDVYKQTLDKSQSKAIHSLMNDCIIFPTFSTIDESIQYATDHKSEIGHTLFYPEMVVRDICRSSYWKDLLEAKKTAFLEAVNNGNANADVTKCTPNAKIILAHVALNELQVNHDNTLSNDSTSNLLDLAFGGNTEESELALLALAEYLSQFPEKLKEFEKTFAAQIQKQPKSVSELYIRLIEIAELNDDNANVKAIAASFKRIIANISGAENIQTLLSTLYGHEPLLSTFAELYVKAPNLLKAIEDLDKAIKSNPSVNIVKNLLESLNCLLLKSASKDSATEQLANFLNIESNPALAELFENFPTQTAELLKCAFETTESFENKINIILLLQKKLDTTKEPYAALIEKLTRNVVTPHAELSDYCRKNRCKIINLTLESFKLESNHSTLDNVDTHKDKPLPAKIVIAHELLINNYQQQLDECGKFSLFTSKKTKAKETLAAAFDNKTIQGEQNIAWLALVEYFHNSPKRLANFEAAFKDIVQVHTEQVKNLYFKLIDLAPTQEQKDLIAESFKTVLIRKTSFSERWSTHCGETILALVDENKEMAKAISADKTTKRAFSDFYPDPESERKTAFDNILKCFNDNKIQATTADTSFETIVTTGLPQLELPPERWDFDSQIAIVVNAICSKNSLYEISCKSLIKGARGMVIGELYANLIKVANPAQQAKVAESFERLVSKPKFFGIFGKTKALTPELAAHIERSLPITGVLRDIFTKHYGNPYSPENKQKLFYALLEVSMVSNDAIQKSLKAILDAITIPGQSDTEFSKAVTDLMDGTNNLSILLKQAPEKTIKLFVELITASRDPNSSINTFRAVLNSKKIPIEIRDKVIKKLETLSMQGNNTATIILRKLPKANPNLDKLKVDPHFFITIGQSELGDLLLALHDRQTSNAKQEEINKLKVIIKSKLSALLITDCLNFNVIKIEDIVTLLTAIRSIPGDNKELLAPFETFSKVAQRENKITIDQYDKLQEALKAAKQDHPETSAAVKTADAPTSAALNPGLKPPVQPAAPPAAKSTGDMHRKLKFPTLKELATDAVSHARKTTSSPVLDNRSETGLKAADVTPVAPSSVAPTPGKSSTGVPPPAPSVAAHPVTPVGGIS
jgi:hypothetical protein